MHAFEELENAVGWDQLQMSMYMQLVNYLISYMLLNFCPFSVVRVLLLHAGGYSQRLPSVSAIGKAFMGIPCGMYNLASCAVLKCVNTEGKSVTPVPSGLDILQCEINNTL